MSSTIHSDRLSLATDELDLLFGLLSHTTRRRVLQYLVSTHRPVTRTELADAVAALARASDDETLPDCERIEVDLHHVHLPKLEDAGVAEETPDGVVLTDFGRRLLETTALDFDIESLRPEIR